jgi:hypothetical protein
MRQVTRGGRRINIKPPALKVQQSKPNHGCSFSRLFISSWLWKFVVLFHIHARTQSLWGEANDKKGCDLLSHIFFAIDRHTFKCILSSNLGQAQFSNCIYYYSTPPPEYVLRWFLFLFWRQNSMIQCRLEGVKEKRGDNSTNTNLLFHSLWESLPGNLNLLRSKEV